MPDLEQIREGLRGYRPRLIGPAPNRASVAVVLRTRDGVPPEILFIERARKAGDPWSGQMAFPGGRLEPADGSTRDAAERETLEEVGLSLAGAEPLGQLDDLEGRHAGRPAGLVISAFVYHHHDPGELRPNHEVAEALWFPFFALAEGERHVEYTHPAVGERTFPGIVVGHPERHVVWGLTYRFVEVLFDALGRPLPQRWGDLER